MADIAIKFGYRAPDAVAVTHVRATATSAAHMARRGNRSFSGTIKRSGTGEQARVFLLDRAGLAVLDETISDSSGNWTMPGTWSAVKCVELALDMTGVDNAGVKDNA